MCNDLGVSLQPTAPGILDQGREDSRIGGINADAVGAYVAKVTSVGRGDRDGNIPWDSPKVKVLL
jgi:hypothetical protein